MGGGGDGGDGGPGDGTASQCIEGTRRCTGDVVEACSAGAYRAVETCTEACHATLGCVACMPGEGTCQGQTSHACLPDGSGYADTFCDPVQGMSCGVASGLCEGACAPQVLGASYIGCEYYPTVTSNLVSPVFEFAVVVSNTSSSAARVTVEAGGLTATRTFTVLAGEVHVERLPWVPELKEWNECCTWPPPRLDVVAARGAYHLRADQPVVVYQFNPLDYTNGAEFSYTNDASLLLPTNAWTGSYLVASYPQWGGLQSLVAITATADGTTVSIRSTTSTNGGTHSTALSPGMVATITLQRGDVFQALSSSGDFTGTFVSADKPVQVIGGHVCTNIPSSKPWCDHLEESMFPVETLATRYVVAPPALKTRIVRVVATEPDTHLTYEPAHGGWPSTIAAPGEFVELEGGSDAFQVSANHKILVAQYMDGQSASGGTGDPAMTLAVPTAQFRRTYLFHAPLNYDLNYVDVLAPVDAVVTLDGAALPAPTAIGATGLGVAHMLLGAGIQGNHTIESDAAFGIGVYGYGQFTSYWYPGGLDLAPIPVQ